MLTHKQCPNKLKTNGYAIHKPPKESTTHIKCLHVDELVTVATTRLETMLGDVAVAVHPDDCRYGHLVGRHLRHPADGRLIPVIADDNVDKEFGTGDIETIYLAFMF